MKYLLISEFPLINFKSVIKIDLMLQNVIIDSIRFFFLSLSNRDQPNKCEPMIQLT